MFYFVCLFLKERNVHLHDMKSKKLYSHTAHCQNVVVVSTSYSHFHNVHVTHVCVLFDLETFEKKFSPILWIFMCK